MGHQRDEVRLRTGGHEQRRLKTEVRRQPLLQGVHRGIFTIDVVAHGGLHHGFAHGRGGTGDGIAAQVDEFHDGLPVAGSDPEFERSLRRNQRLRD